MLWSWLACKRRALWQYFGIQTDNNDTLKMRWYADTKRVFCGNDQMSVESVPRKIEKVRGGEYSLWLEKRGVCFAEDAFGIEEQVLFHKTFSRYISKNIKEIPFFYDHIFPPLLKEKR